MEKEIKLTLAVVPQDFLDKMEAKMKIIITLLQRQNEEELSQQWIESAKIPKLLGISLKTWQTYRDKKLIKFSQIGAKIFVNKSDLDYFLQSHSVEANKGWRDFNP